MSSSKRFVTCGWREDLCTLEISNLSKAKTLVCDEQKFTVFNNFSRTPNITLIKFKFSHQHLGNTGKVSKKGLDP